MSRVGYLRHDDLYLDPTAAYGAAQQQARRVGDNLSLNEQTLGKRMKERRLLMVESSRDTNKTRVTIHGQRLDLWHLNSSVMGVVRWEDDPDPMDEGWSPTTPEVEGGDPTTGDYESDHESDERTVSVAHDSN